MARCVNILLLPLSLLFISAIDTTTLPPPPTTEPPPPPPPSTMTTPMMTTTPGGCVTDKGDRLAVGESRQYTYELSCEIFRCESPGQVSQMIGDCFFPPRCVDPERRPGACCRSCPNGENCRLPSGEIIKAGSDVEYNGLTCRCPEMSWDNFGQDYTAAECKGATTTPPPPTTTTTTPPPPPLPPSPVPGCRLPNGTVLADMKPGDRFQPDPCTFCHCGDDWTVFCAVRDCARPLCDDYVVPEGQCCPQCPVCDDTSEQCRYWASNAECQKNPNWMLRNCKKSCAVCQAECVDTDQHCQYWSESGYCDSNPVWMKHNCPVSCDACKPRTIPPSTPPPPTTTTPPPPPPPPTTTPFTTTPPRPECRTWYGDVLYPGQEKTYYEEGACTTCSCIAGESDAICMVADCLVPMCVDKSKPPGACCATCPNGPNCRIPATGEVISGGQTVVRDGRSCRCPPQSYDLPGVQRPEHITAICTAATTAPPPTTTPSSGLVG